MNTTETILTPASANEARDSQSAERGSSSLVSPPDGFRLLVDGERTKRGDIFCLFGKWLPAKGYNAKWNSRQYWPMARRANGMDEGRRTNDTATTTDQL